MHQVGHSLVSMLHKQPIHIHPVHELLWSAAADPDVFGRASDISLVRSSNSDE